MHVIITPKGRKFITSNDPPDPIKEAPVVTETLPAPEAEPEKERKRPAAKEGK